LHSVVRSIFYSQLSWHWSRSCWIGSIRAFYSCDWQARNTNHPVLHLLWILHPYGVEIIEGCRRWCDVRLFCLWHIISEVDQWGFDIFTASRLLSSRWAGCTICSENISDQFAKSVICDFNMLYMYIIVLYVSIIITF